MASPSSGNDASDALRSAPFLAPMPRHLAQSCTGPWQAVAGVTSVTSTTGYARCHHIQATQCKVTGARPFHSLRVPCMPGRGWPEVAHEGGQNAGDGGDVEQGAGLVAGRARLGRVQRRRARRRRALLPPPCADVTAGLRTPTGHHRTPLQEAFVSPVAHLRPTKAVLCACAALHAAGEHGACGSLQRLHSRQHSRHAGELASSVSWTGTGPCRAPASPDGQRRETHKEGQKPVEGPVSTGAMEQRLRNRRLRASASESSGRSATSCFMARPSAAASSRRPRMVCRSISASLIGLPPLVTLHRTHPFPQITTARVWLWCRTGALACAASWSLSRRKDTSIALSRHAGLHYYSS